MIEDYIDNNDSSRLNRVIEEVKSELKKQNQRMLITRKEVVIKLGKAFEAEVSDSEWICQEIKNALKTVILQKLISNRDIERYCLPNWKKKTKPKKDNEKDSDNLSFSEKKQPLMITRTDGKVILEDQDDSDANERMPAILGSGYEEVELSDAELSDIESPGENKSTLNGDDCLQFEFSLPYDKLQKHMAVEFNSNKGTEPVWIHGILDKLTGRIINADLGRATA